MDTDTQIVAIAETLIESTGFYTMDLREWNRTDNAQKTWVKFKVHFLRSFCENWEQSRQSQHDPKFGKRRYVGGNDTGP